jgi:uncharacterized protein with HEPN domain
MSFRNSETFLLDILKSVAAIELFVTGLNFEGYEASHLIRSAVERQLQILTEAAFRLRENAEVLCPSVDWRAIRGLGNFLRHEYDIISDRQIWESIHNELPPLKLAVSGALSNLERPRN